MLVKNSRLRAGIPNGYNLLGRPTRRSTSAVSKRSWHLQTTRSACQHDPSLPLGSRSILVLLHYGRSQLARLRELGPSLADVATFMQEMDIQQGYTTQKQDGRGIERLRRVALELEGLSKKTNGTTVCLPP